MQGSIYTRLSIMMFLQFFVWGAWFVTLGTYLNAIDFTATDIASAFDAQIGGTAGASEPQSASQPEAQSELPDTFRSIL